MKKIFPLFLAFVCVVSAYDNVSAHREFNRVVVERFMARASSLSEFSMYTFGLETTSMIGPAVVEPGLRSVTVEDRDLTAKDWIVEGGYSADEPEVPAAFRHFYDPVAKNEGKYYLTDLKTDVVNPAIDAIYWHFDGSDPLDITNIWTWKAGKEHLVAGLSTADEAVAKRSFAMAFRCLGEVLHNTADMGCPPHVRNDAHGGYPGVGGSDPYESLFDPAWVAEYAATTADPSISAFAAAATTAKDINVKLAEFTNANFFSYETISGTGVKAYSSYNKMPDYPSPKLERLTYDPITFNYSSVFLSGRTVIHCNDQSLFMGYFTSNFRSYPRIPLEAVRSQAAELVPSIVTAGVNVVRLFIPQLLVEVSANLNKHVIEGAIQHTSTTEYPSEISYCGKVDFFINNKLSKTSVIAENGLFSMTSMDFKGGDRITAFINIGGISVKSEEYVVDDTQRLDTTLSIMPIAFDTDPKSLGSSGTWSGPVVSYTNTFEAQVLAPSGTSFRIDEYATSGDRRINVYCKNPLPVEVVMRQVADEFVPEKWTWSKPVSSSDSVHLAFIPQQTAYTMQEGGYNTGLAQTVNVIRTGNLLTFTIKFDPQTYFPDQVICSTIDIALQPVITCSDNTKWDNIDASGNVIATKYSTLYFSVSFWKDY